MNLEQPYEKLLKINEKIKKIIKYMQDFSHLDQKYFLDTEVYNCPFCNRNNVHYEIVDEFVFNWNEKKLCHGFIARCSSCKKKSMHLSYIKMTYEGQYGYHMDDKKDIDNYIFYSAPTSFFVLDNRIPKIIRELITEAEGSLKMNFLTGASSCSRKAIYELTIIEKCDGEKYEEKIKYLKNKYPDTDPELFDILYHIQGMTSDKIHEQSWDQWDAKNIKLILETLKTVLFDIYVVPEIKKGRASSVKQLLEKIKNKDGTKEDKTNNAN